MSPRICIVVVAALIAGLALMPTAHGQDAKGGATTTGFVGKEIVKGSADSPIVAWPYLGKRRPATPEQVAEWVKQLGDTVYKVRDAATKALGEVGEPAVAALQEAIRTGDVEMQKRARQIIDRIEVSEALAPTVIDAKFADTPLPQAVAQFSKQSKVKLELVPQQGPARQLLDQKKITLELAGVPFWEALDKLCQAGNVTYTTISPSSLQLQLVEGTRPPPPIAQTGPFRMRITNLNYYRNIVLAQAAGAAQPPGRTETLTAGLDLVSEPQVTVLSMGAPQILEAVDDNGQSLVTDKTVTTSTSGTATYTTSPTPINPLQVRQAQFQLRPADKPSATLKVLRGTIPVEVLARQKPLLVVDDLFANKARIVKGEGDLMLVVMQVQDHGGGRNGNIRFFLNGVDSVDPSRFGANNVYNQRFEVTDSEGRRLSHNMNLNYSGNMQQRSLEGYIHFQGAQDAGQAARLTYNSNKTFRTSVPFEFRDVPLP